MESVHPHPHIPSPEAEALRKEYETLYYEFSDLSRRRGTNGERGIFGQYKSVRSKMAKLAQKIKTYGYTFKEHNYSIYLKVIQNEN